MLQRRNAETLPRQARMMLGKLKLSYSRNWQATWQQELLLPDDKNKKGKCRLAADRGKSTADTHRLSYSMHSLPQSSPTRSPRPLHIQTGFKKKRK